MNLPADRPRIYRPPLPYMNASDYCTRYGHNRSMVMSEGIPRGDLMFCGAHDAYTHDFRAAHPVQLSVKVCYSTVPAGYGFSLMDLFDDM